MLHRIFYAKAGKFIGPNNPLRMLGNNTSWTDDESREFANKVNNLVNSGHAVFTIPMGCPDDVDDCIHGHIGAAYPAGLYDL